MEQSPTKSASDEYAPEISGNFETDGPPPPTPKRDRFLWGVLPIALLLVVSAFFVSEAAKSQNDVQIGAPLFAQVGRGVPVFGFHFGEGYGELGGAEFVQVNLVDDQGEIRAETTLVAGDIIGYFGQLPAVDVAGEYELRAEAMPRRDPPETVTRRIFLETDPEQITLRGRRQTELQRWKPGSVVSLSDAEAPEHLDARVSGGACVPGEDCVLFVWVGEPAAAIGLVRSGGVEPTRSDECGEVAVQDQAGVEEFSLEGGLHTSGVIRCTLRVNASEGYLRILAFRDGSAVAERPLQLPIGFAAPVVDIETAHLRSGQSPRFVSSDETLLATLYEDSQLRRIELVGPNPTFEGPLPEGLWRAQFRHDAFGSEHVATRLFVVHDQPLRYLAAHPSQRRWLDPMARERPVCEGVPCSTERLVRFMLAAGELEVARAPTTSSGKVQALTRHTDEGEGRRFAGVGLVLFAGLLVAWAIYRRGMRSAALTRKRFRAASADMPTSARADKRASLSAGIFVFLVFAAVAALVFSRSCVAVFS